MSRQINRILSAILIIVLLLLCTPNSFALPYKLTPPLDGNYVLPTSLERIEQEAFAGTAPIRVFISIRVQYIGDKAFENASRLQDICIPSSVQFIGEDVFPKRNSLTIYGQAGSYAEMWAESHLIAFVKTNYWELYRLFKKLLSSWNANVFRHTNTIKNNDDTVKALADSYKSMRPQDRPELYPIDYRFP